MKTIYFVRHGESQSNVMRVFTSSPGGFPLTERGEEQAKRTSEFFLGLRDVAFFSSNIIRAIQTAEIIAEPHSKKVFQVEDFAELRTGCLEGKKNSEETDGYYQHILQQWIEGRSEVSFDGGEDHLTALERTKRGIGEVISSENNGVSVIVSHGGIMTMTIPFLCGNVDPEVFYSDGKNRFIDNCAICEIRVNGNNPGYSLEMVSWGTTDHLPGDLKYAIYRKKKQI